MALSLYRMLAAHRTYSPYAISTHIDDACISGAEGTIIEEQGDLPRMIWGLEGEEVSHRPKPEPEHSTTQGSRHAPPHVQPIITVPTSSGTSSKPLSRQQAAVPPRFHARKSQEETPVTYAHYDSSGPTRATAPPKPVAKPRYEYALPEHGPIDLTSLRPRSDTMPRYQLDSDASTTMPFRSLEDNPRFYNSPDQIDLGWQSLLLTQERLKNLTLSSGALSPDSLQQSHSSTSLASLASSRSPIILDPPSHLSRNSWAAVPPQTQLSSAHNTPRRMSALEIAQSYRQQQLSQDRRKQQALLPTPPNSSSPLWSSGFSPYQESLLSPEIIAAARLPTAFANKLSAAQYSQNYAVPQADLQQANRLYDYEQHEYRNLGPRSQMNRTQPGVPNAQDFIQYRHLQPGNNDSSLIAATNRLRYPQGRPSVQNVGPLHSPVLPPKAPPNTPSTTVFRDSRHASSQNKPPSVVVPLSPTSPKTRQTVAQQHPRSIPLSRLIQRRLSAVPEEDSVLLSDRAPTPPLTDLSAEPSANRYVASPINSTGVHERMMFSADHIPCVNSSSGGKGSSTTPLHSAKMTKDRDTKMAQEDSGQRNDSREMKSTRGVRARGRGGRGKRGRVPLSNVVNGPERVNGGMTVHS